MDDDTIYPPTDAELAAYFSGHATPAEYAAIRVWALTDPGAFEAARMVWDVTAARNYDVNAAAFVERFERRVFHTAASATPTGGTRRPTHTLDDSTSGRYKRRGTVGHMAQRTLLFTGAALAAVLITIGGARALSIALQRSEPAATHDTEYVTARGQRATITLHDGTRVRLNVASRLRVPNDFGAGTRNVSLEGEAQFDVTHDAKHPFAVSANGMLIRDIGTSFDVRAYGAGSTTIAVREGRVAVQAYADTLANRVLVDARQRATVGSDGTTKLTAVKDADGDFAWADGQLVFHVASVGSAFAQLSRWYDLDFHAADNSILDKHLTATVPDTLTQAVIEDIAAALDCRVERVGNTVEFTPLK